MKQILRSAMPFAAALTLGLVSFETTAATESQGPVGYDFTYGNKGDRSVAPTQVFDNNKETFFQFSPDKTIPAIFAVSPCDRKVLLTPQARGPYLVVKGVYRTYSLQIGSRTSTVEYAGKKEIALEENIANEPACPKKVGAAYGPVDASRMSGVASPTHGDGSPVAAAAKREAPVQTFAVAPAGVPSTTGAPSASRPSESAAPTASLAQSGTWEIRPTDLTIYAAMKRWAAQAKHQLTWEIPVDYPVTILDRFNGTFEEAVKRAMDAYEIADLQPKACFYDNNVVRIVRRVGDGKECRK